MYIYKYKTYYENGSKPYTKFYENPELAVCIAITEARQFNTDFYEIKYTELNDINRVGHKWSVIDKVSGKVIFTVEVTRARIVQLDPTDYNFPQDLVKLSEQFTKKLQEF